jgi:hypothetical protein
MVLARPAISSSGRKATRTAAATSTALTAKAITPVIISTRRRVRRASETSAASTARVRLAPSTRVGALSVMVVVLIAAPLVIGGPNSVPFRSTRCASTPPACTRFTICRGPAPDRASCRASCAWPASRALRFRLDCAMKIAVTAMLSKINITAKTIITASVTRNLSETVFSGLLAAPAGRSSWITLSFRAGSRCPVRCAQVASATRLELATQRGDVHFDQVLVKTVVAPDRGQDLGLANHSVAVRGEVAEQPPLGISQVERLPATLQDHQIGRKGWQQSFKLASVSRRGELETLGGQRSGDRHTNGVAVLDHQDPSRCHTVILHGRREQANRRN